MGSNQYKIKAYDIKELISPMGFCYASDTITVDGMKVGYMYRETREDDDDSGWRFLSGTETDEYVDDDTNSMFFEVNVIANYDPAIIPYLKMPVGTELEREEGTDNFKKIE
ncbi:MAG TPA: DUF2185 domain-containing protein [Williamwhitmania sp.]|nr:DUF2185 domain-containing protein [Williamwhitmania sp.]